MKTERTKDEITGSEFWKLKSTWMSGNWFGQFKNTEYFASCKYSKKAPKLPCIALKRFWTWSCLMLLEVGVKVRLKQDYKWSIYKPMQTASHTADCLGVLPLTGQKPGGLFPGKDKTLWTKCTRFPGWRNYFKISGLSAHLQVEFWRWQRAVSYSPIL